MEPPDHHGAVAAKPLGRSSGISQPSATAMPGSSFKSIAMILFGSLALGVFVLIRWRFLVNFADFESYVAATHRALDGQAIYTHLQTAGPYQLPEIIEGRGFAYPPTAILVLLPTAIGMAAAVPFVVVSLTLLSAVVVLICRAELRSVSWIGWPLAFLLLMSPAGGDAVYVGQITPLLAAGYGASWLFPRMSGYVGVIAGAIKLYPAALLFWAVRNRADIKGPLLTAAILVLAATLWLGAEQWIDFLTAWRNARPQCTSPSLGSLTCSLGAAGFVVGLGSVLGLCLAALRIGSAPAAFFLIAVASVISAPDLFPNYLLIVAVGALPLLCRLLMRFGPPRASPRIGRMDS